MLTARPSWPTKYQADYNAYVPSSNESEIDSDIEAKEIKGDELKSNEFEVETVDGKIKVVSGTPLTAEEATKKEDEIAEAVLEDTGFSLRTSRRLVRFASIGVWYVGLPFCISLSC